MVRYVCVTRTVFVAGLPTWHVACPVLGKRSNIADLFAVNLLTQDPLLMDFYQLWKF